MNNDLNKYSLNFSFNSSQIFSIFGLYIFSLGSTLLGFGLYLLLESFGTVDRNYINWSGQGLFWTMITLCIGIFLLFIPIEFFRNYKLINRSFNELLTNIISVIAVSLIFLILSQIALGDENIIFNQYQVISRSVSFSGFITIPLILFVIHNFGRNFQVLNKYSYSVILFIWILSNQIFL
jgi:hypothetical protein